MAAKKAGKHSYSSGSSRTSARAYTNKVGSGVGKHRKKSTRGKAKHRAK